ncbi:MAG: hypothetical protein AAGA46_03250 [Cyanobacteria bacterium P01_F01_bin.13]
MTYPSLWTRAPRPRFTKTYNVIRSHGVGAVIPANAWTLYKDLDPAQPDWSYIDERIKALPTGHPIHIHPILNRGPKETWQRMTGNLKALVCPVLERYGDRVERFTICNELMLHGLDRQKELIQLFYDLDDDFPNLKLWFGEYGLRSKHRVQGGDGVLDVIDRVQSVASNFEGVVAIDYIDLSQSGTNNYLMGLANQFRIPGRYIREHAPETLFEWITAVESLYKSFAAPQKLSDNLAAIAQTGAKVALETSVYTGPNPSHYTEACQKIAYQALLNLAQSVDADFWHWNLCDASCSIAWQKERTDEECPGWFDRDGQVKGWARGFLKQTPQP